MFRRSLVVMFVGGVVLVAAACTSVSTTGNPVAARPLATPGSSGPAPTSSTAAQATSERGMIVKKVGEIAGIKDKRQKPDEYALRFAITAITVDAKCGSEYAMKPEQGHFIRVDFNIETAAHYSRDMNFRPDALQFSIRGPDGLTDSNLGSMASYTCLADAENLLDTVNPASKYVGAVVLDSRLQSGILLFQPYALDGTGWEWAF